MRQVVLVGTPNYGSIAALQDAITGIGSDFPIAWSVFVCEPHQNLSANATFRDNLLNTLLYGVRQSTGTPARAD